MPHYIEVETAHNVKIDFEVASLMDRILGSLIDSMVTVAYLVVVIFLISIFADGVDNLFGAENRTLAIILAVILIAPLVFYHLLMEIFFNGQSIGKMAMKTRVVSMNGKPVSIGSYIIRWLFRLVDFQITSSVGALVAVAAGGKGQRIGDMVAGTSVISLKPATVLRSTAHIAIPDDYKPEYPEVEHKLNKEDMVLIKEVLQLQQDNKYELINKVAEKVQDTLEVQMRQRAHPFLVAVLKDYNYYNNKEVDVEEELRKKPDGLS